MGGNSIEQRVRRRIERRKPEQAKPAAVEPEADLREDVVAAPDAEPEIEAAPKPEEIAHARSC